MQNRESANEDALAAPLNAQPVSARSASSGSYFPAPLAHAAQNPLIPAGPVKPPKNDIHSSVRLRLQTAQFTSSLPPVKRNRGSPSNLSENSSTGTSLMPCLRTQPKRRVLCVWRSAFQEAEAQKAFEDASLH
ncbi:hypothetical protein HDU97_001646 [Phlyctochytrium planicorne]|nr:hypothetical protein HDU97_001646 [Phlyctochytrium planicorne]